MIQDAIWFTEQNADMIAEQLHEGWTGETLVEEYMYMFTQNSTLVLVRDVLDSGFACLSYVVHLSFWRNTNEDAPVLNDKTFTKVREF